MKKLIVIGAMSDVVDICKAAKELGVYVVNFRNDFYAEPNAYADEVRKLDLFDEEAVLEAAKEVKPDGILANADLYMPIAAYVGEKLGLRVNNPEAIKTLRSKYLFRQVLKGCGLYTPKFVRIETEEELPTKTASLKYPIILKPICGNGSYGSCRFESFDAKAMVETYRKCMLFPGCTAVVAEEFVGTIKPILITGVGFCHKGEFVWSGIAKDRHSEQYPLISTTTTYPSKIVEGDAERLAAATEKVLTASGFTYGAFDVEAMLIENGDVFIIEINPRQGGNRLPWMAEKHSGISSSKLLVSTAVGDDSYFEAVKRKPHDCRAILMQIIYADKKGTYVGLKEEVGFPGRRIYSKNNVPLGGKVTRPAKLTDSLASVYYEFDSIDDMLKVRDEMEKWVRAIILPCRWYHKLRLYKWIKWGRCA